MVSEFVEFLKRIEFVFAVAVTVLIDISICGALFGPTAFEH
ncbi:hypothetical protein [Halorhabdus tiamatea]|nr:hypothetical protein [Halorhabdus tiamatea]